MPVFPLIQQILIVFLEILTGYIASRCGIMTSRDRKFLSNLIMAIIIPCSMIASTGMETGSGTVLLLQSAGLMLLYFIGCIVICTGLIRALPLSTEESSVFIGTAVYANVAFIGIPLTTSVLGDIGMVFAVGSIIAYNLLFYIHCIRVFNPTSNPSVKDFITPLNISTVIMAVMLLYQIRLPAMLQTFFSAVGNCSTPLMLICAGTLLADTDLAKALTNPFLYGVTALRCLLLPLAFMLILRLLPLDSRLCMGICILAACPTAVSVSVVATQADVKPHLAAQAVAHTTLLSLFTLPIIMFLAGKLFL